MRGYLVAALLVAGTLSSSAGCGGGVPRYDVSGTVSFDGQPVERGEVSLIPDDPAQPPEGGLIESGRFRFQATAGPKTVQIRGSRPLPPERQDNPDMGLLYEDFIPARYNRESTLKAEVKPRGSNVFDYQLTSQDAVP
jgi:hypothetical protein